LRQIIRVLFNGFIALEEAVFLGLVGKFRRVGKKGDALNLMV